MSQSVQLVSDLTPDRAKHLTERGIVVSEEALAFLAEKFESAVQVQKEIEKHKDLPLVPLVIFDRDANVLVLLWGKDDQGDAPGVPG